MALWVELLAEAGYWRRAGLSALVSVSWLGPATIWMVDLTLVGWPLAVLGFAAMHAVAGALVRPTIGAAPPSRRHSPWPSCSDGPGPSAGAAGNDGHGPGVQPARSCGRIGGPLLLAALTAVGGVTLAAILSARLRPAIVGLAVLVAAWLAAIVAPGSEPIDVDGNRDDAAGITVAAVQGGGPQNTRADVCEQRAVFERHLDTTREQVTTPVDLVVWPRTWSTPAVTTAITPARCDQPLLADSEARAALSDLARELDTVLIVGFFERTADQKANRNYAAAYDPSGVPVDTYDKVQLVPFGEYVRCAPPPSDSATSFPPGTFGRDPPMSPRSSTLRWTAGRGHLLGDLLRPPGPQRDRRRRRQGAADPTNGSSYWLTVVQTQQIASSRLRAIETDRWVVQAAPTGFSAVITPEGDVIERTGISESRVIQTTVELRHGDTLAVRLGAWPVAVAAALTLSLALGLGRVLTRLIGSRGRADRRNR